MILLTDEEGAADDPNSTLTLSTALAEALLNARRNIPQEKDAHVAGRALITELDKRALDVLGGRRFTAAGAAGAGGGAGGGTGQALNGSVRGGRAGGAAAAPLSGGPATWNAKKLQASNPTRAIPQSWQVAIGSNSSAAAATTAVATPENFHGGGAPVTGFGGWGSGESSQGAGGAAGASRSGANGGSAAQAEASQRPGLSASAQQGSQASLLSGGAAGAGSAPSAVAPVAAAAPAHVRISMDSTPAKAGGGGAATSASASASATFAAAAAAAAASASSRSGRHNPYLNGLPGRRPSHSDSNRPLASGYSAVPLPDAYAVSAMHAAQSMSSWHLPSGKKNGGGGCRSAADLTRPKSVRRLTGSADTDVEAGEVSNTGLWPEWEREIRVARRVSTPRTAPIIFSPIAFFSVVFEAPDAVRCRVASPCTRRETSSRTAIASARLLFYFASSSPQPSAPQSSPGYV